MSMHTIIRWTTLVVLAALGSATQAADAPGHLFDPIHSVLTHPRCINCHVADDVPLQLDAGLPHAQNVHAGADRKGVPGLACSACHQEQNAAAAMGDHAPPGAPNWHLAPAEMVWVNRSPADICQRLKDPKHNGGKTPEQLLKHFADDPLVAWGWNPGGKRSVPPLTLDQTVAAVSAWIEADMPCPVEAKVAAN
jgi:hypothetical protein